MAGFTGLNLGGPTTAASTSKDPFAEIMGGTSTAAIS